MDNLFDLNSRLTELIDELMEAQQDLELAGKNWAISENAYRMAKAQRFLEQTNGTVQFKAAVVDSLTETQRINAHVAEAHKEACLEKVRSLRAALNAMQSIGASIRAEMELAGHQ